MGRMSEKAFEQGLFKDKENYIEWLESKLDLIYENNNNANKEKDKWQTKL